MKYERIERATFLERPNRFIAYARIAGKQEIYLAAFSWRFPLTKKQTPGAHPWAGTGGSSDVYVRRTALVTG